MTSIINRTQITDNNVTDYGASVSRFGDVAWTQVLSNGDSDVLYRNGVDNSVTRIGNSLRQEYGAVMSNDGGVVFSDFNGDPDLRTYSGLSGESVRTVAASTRAEYGADIDGFYNVVYTTQFSPTDSDLVLFNASTGIATTIANRTSNELNPDINGNFVAYEVEFSPTDHDIDLYNISAGTTTTVAFSAQNDYNAHVLDNGNVIYQHQFSATDSDIYMYNAASGQTSIVSGSSRNDIGLQTGGNYATWEGYDGNDWEVFRFDATSGQVTQVTNNSVDDYVGDVSAAGYVVYQHQFSAADSDIYLYDGSSSIAVATSTRPEYDPHIAGNYIAWTQSDGHDSEIYRAQIAA